MHSRSLKDGLFTSFSKAGDFNCSGDKSTIETPRSTSSYKLLSVFHADASVSAFIATAVSPALCIFSSYVGIRAFKSCQTTHKHTISSSSALVGHTMIMAGSGGNVTVPKVWGCLDIHCITCISRMNMSVLPLPVAITSKTSSPSSRCPMASSWKSWVSEGIISRSRCRHASWPASNANNGICAICRWISISPLINAHRARVVCYSLYAQHGRQVSKCHR